MRQVDADRARMLTELRDICQRCLFAFGSESFTVNDVARRALPAARKICERYLDHSTLDALLPIIQRLIPKKSTSVQIQLPLKGFENIKLPWRIAVPPEGSEQHATEEDYNIKWVELRRATVAEADRNIQMRDGLIEGAQVERDLIFAVVEAARARGAQDDDVIGEILR